MKRFLPSQLVFLIIAIFSQMVFSLFVPVAQRVYAADPPIPTITPTIPITPTPTIPSSGAINIASPEDLPSDWIIDPVVTSIGKNAARAGIFLDWALQNYDWSYVDVENGKTNPLIPFWITLRNIVYALMILVVIAGSLVLIITRGRSVTLRRFIPRFLAIILLVTFSFAFVEALYVIVDVFQGFFIKPGGVLISQKDLLYVSWKYQSFVGLRALGGENFESAFISLLLVKLTSFTYYAMVGILLVRKIILWFFIMVSPFFPLLLLFYPLRNTAKIWLGEFFRWLLYAPLFAIFLAGLVSLWKTGIPLYFNFTDSKAGLVVFPTAVSILLGGPLQKVGVANSVNLADTFGLYLVALLMLWMVIIFPFILLQIFLDYLSNININQNALARQLVNFIARPPAPSGGTPPPSPSSTGLARALPFLRDFAIPKAPATANLAREIPRVTQTQKQQQTVVLRPVSVSQKEEVEKLTNITVPTLRDIARYDLTKLQKDTDRKKEVEKIKETLRNIATPETIRTTSDRERYSVMRERLSEQSKSGNQLAATILNAAKTVANKSVSSVQNTTNITSLVNNLMNPASVTEMHEREKYVEIREKLRSEEKSNTLAPSVLSAMQAITTTSQHSLQTLVQSLSSPEKAPEDTRETVTSLKETLSKESEKGNALATTILSLLTKQDTAALEKVQGELEKAKTDGNPLAARLLAVASLTSTEKQKEQLSALQTEIAKEKEKGNPLALALSDMMGQKAKAVGKQESFPTTNRIQEVSLDDYEAVKKMWTENYQHLETTGNVDDSTAKKQSIEDDIKQIAETIDLLTSEDAEKVKEGMQKVSDILPFLLIGGFSQSEIVAYLKAKEEAGKQVLSEINKLSNDEETKVEVSRHSETVQKVQSASADFSAKPESEALEESQSQKQPLRTTPSVIAPPKLLSSQGLASTQMLRLANIRIPSIRDVAAYDEALVSRDQERSQEVQKMKDALTMITNPLAAKDVQTRERYEDIHKTLVTEEEKGNPFASAVVSAGRLVQRLSANAAFSEALQLAQILKKLADPAGIGNEKEKEVFVNLLQTIRFQSQNGSATASRLLKAIDLSDQQSIADTLSLREMLLRSNADGDQIATTVMARAAQVGDGAIKASRDELMGMYLLIDSLVNKNAGDDTDGKTAQLSLEVKKKAYAGNIIAKSLFSVQSTSDLSQIVSLVKKVQQSQDQFAKQLQIALPTLSSPSFVQTGQSGVSGALLKILSLLAHPLKDEADAKESTLRLQLFEAKKQGNALASMVLAKADQQTRLEIKAVAEILQNIEHPEAIASLPEQESYKNLRNRLKAEDANNNELARQILTVSHMLSEKSMTPLDKVALSVMAFEKLQGERQHGNELASEMLAVCEKVKTKEQLSLELPDVLSSLSHPEKVQDGKKRDVLISFQKTILSEKEKGNALAKLLSLAMLDSKKETTDSEVLDALEENLHQQEEKGSPLAREFVALFEEEETSAYFAVLRLLNLIADPNTASSDDDKKAYQAFRLKLTEASEKDNLVAMSILAATERIKTQGDDLSEAKKIHDLLLHDNSETGVQMKNMIAQEKSIYEDLLLLRSILHGITKPSYVSDVPLQKSYDVLAKAIALEAQQGNNVSKMTQKTMGDINASGISTQQELSIVLKLYQLFLREKEAGNARSQEILGLIQTQKTRMRASRLVSVLQAVASPTQVPPGIEQAAYVKMKQDLVTARNNGDQLAKLLLSLSQSFSANKVTEDNLGEIMTLLFEKLTTEKKQGNPFAESILSLLRPSSLDKETKEVEDAILRDEKRDDPVAKALMAMIRLSQEESRRGDALVIPSKNRIQEVSLDDYEAVRSMWTESYKNLEVPVTLIGEKPSRMEWLRQDITRIEDAIGLLASADEEKINRGTAQVANILPFLLIGGFSLSEIVAYLKAKLQAAKTVASGLETDKEETFVVKKDTSSQKPEKTNEAAE